MRTPVRPQKGVSEYGSKSRERKITFCNICFQFPLTTSFSIHIQNPFSINSILVVDWIFQRWFPNWESETNWWSWSTACNDARWCKLLAHAIRTQFPKPPAPPPSTWQNQVWLSLATWTEVMYGLTSHHDKDCHHHHLPDWAWHTRGLPPSPVQASFPFSVPAHTFNGFSSFLSLYIDKCFVALSLPKFRYDHVGCALFSSCFSFYTDLSLRELESVSNSRLFLVERALQCCVALRGGNQRDVNLLKDLLCYLSHYLHSVWLPLIFQYWVTTLCWMNWNDPENSSFPHPAVQHLKERWW